MNFVDLGRSFVPVEKDAEADLEIGWLWGRRLGGWLDWPDLLRHWRVVLLAEAASGKTEEFRYQAQALSTEGRAAFFVTIEDLADEGFAAALGSQEIDAFERWHGLASTSGTPEGWFFLDSVDEARLNAKSLDRALRHFARDLGAAVERARIFVSCRASDWKGAEDRRSIDRILPVRARPTALADLPEPEAALLDPIFKERPRSRGTMGEDAPKRALDELLVVRLVPLSRVQRTRLAQAVGVPEPERYALAIEQNGLDALADRPGDLIDLAEYWKTHERFGSLSEMTEHAVARKLRERPYRQDNHLLDDASARQGAERLAAGLTLGKSFTLRTSGSGGDPTLAAGALDPADLLPGWSEAQRNALIRRGVFAPATYGRVRFHHRGTQEYLAAQWLARLLHRGCPRDEVKSLLFADPYGLETVVPSLQAISAWLAKDYPDIRDELIRREPLVLLRHGDPRSLPVDAKEQLLLAYAAHHARGEISDDRLDHRAVWMFATPRLAAGIRRAWAINDRHAFRSDLLNLIREGKIAACIDLVRPVALDPDASPYLRILAVQALAACDDEPGLVASAEWLKANAADSRATTGFTKVLFPRHLDVMELLRLVERTPPGRRGTLEGFDYALDELWTACPDDGTRLILCEGLGRLCLAPPFLADYQRISRRFHELAQSLEPVARAALRHFQGDPAPDEIIPALMAVERADRRGRSLHDDDQGATLEDLVNGRHELKRRLFWADVDEVRRNGPRGEDQPSALWQVRPSYRPSLWRLDVSDQAWLEADVRQREHEDDRRIALDAIVGLLRLVLQPGFARCRGGGKP